MINHATQQATLDAPTETLECHAEKNGFCSWQSRSVASGNDMICNRPVRSADGKHSPFCGMLPRPGISEIVSVPLSKNMTMILRGSLYCQRTTYSVVSLT